jgi:hypothetical protein
VTKYILSQNSDGKFDFSRLVDKTVAIRVRDSGMAATKEGDKLRVRCDLWEFDFEEEELVPLGTQGFFQQVLTRDLARQTPGDIWVHKVIKPAKAYLLVMPDPEHHKAIETIMNDFEPPPFTPKPGQATTLPGVDDDDEGGYDDDAPF